MFKQLLQIDRQKFIPISKDSVRKRNFQCLAQEVKDDVKTKSSAWKVVRARDWLTIWLFFRHHQQKTKMLKRKEKLQILEFRAKNKLLAKFSRPSSICEDKIMNRKNFCCYIKEKRMVKVSCWISSEFGKLICVQINSRYIKPFFYITLQTIANISKITDGLATIA